MKRYFCTLIVILGFTISLFAQNFSEYKVKFNNRNLTVPDTGYVKTSPCAADFDGDGDVDFIIGTMNNNLIYYRNDDINTNVGGNDSTIDNTVIVLISRSLVTFDSQNSLAPAAGDLNGDGKIDLIVGTNSGSVYYLENTGVDNNIPQFGNPVLLVNKNGLYNAKPFLIDMDGDGDLDLFVGFNNGEVDYYKNTGDSSQYNFVLDTENITGTRGNLYHAAPALTDIDGDGVPDMLIGHEYHRISYYQGHNDNGTISFTKVTDTFGNLYFDEDASPYTVDIKSDGVKDLIVGQFSGNIRYYTDITSTPVLVDDMLCSFDIGDYSVPFLYDIDGDGDLDLLVAHGKTIALYENTGNGGQVNFTKKIPNYITTSLNITSMDMWDYDRDGDPDLFIGTELGGVGLYENTGTSNGLPTFTEIKKGDGTAYQTDCFDTIHNPEYGASICIVDIDGDGDMDFIIGSMYGTSAFYRNDDINLNAGGTDDTLDGWQEGDFKMVKDGSSDNNSFFPFALSTDSSLKARDIDGDGDFDFFLSTYSGYVYKITNTGTPTNPQFEKDSSPLANVRFDNLKTREVKAKIELKDLNGDGWYDIILGGKTGGLKFYTNNASQDSTPPTDPSNFSGTALSDSKIKLTWGISTDLHGTGVAGYIIKRYQGGNLEATIKITNPVATFYVDTGLTQETTYDYEIYAIDFAGNQSSVVTTEVQTGPPPYLDHFQITTPSGVVGKTFQITIKAISNYGFVYDDFNDTVNLTVSEGNISPTSTVLTNGVKTLTLTYTNDNAQDNIQLTITVSYNNISNNSNPVSIDIIPPDTPNLSQAIASSSTSVSLLWDNVYDHGGAPNYFIDIYRNGTKIVTLNGTTTQYVDNTCHPETQYTYYLKSRDSVGNISSASNTLTVTTPQPEEDTTPPTTPTDLRAVSVGETFVAMTWNPSTDSGGSGLAGYEIYRGSNKIATVNAGTTTYSDQGLSPNTQYTYHVRAFDNAGNHSNFSNTLLVTTSGQHADTTPPTTPQNLTANAVDEHSIHLTWSASTDSGGSGLAGYRIYREDAGNYTQIIGSVGANTTEYTDTGLQEGTTYRYKVKAIDNAGNMSNFSNVAEATTMESNVDRENPTAPTNVQVEALSPQDAKLTWSPSTDNVAVAYYKIFKVVRSSNPFQEYEYELLGQTQETNFTITGLTPGETYDFCVQAVDTSGNKSRFSQTVEVTMPDASNDHTPPYPPENLHFVQVSSEGVIIEYNAAHDDENGSGIKQYHIYRNDIEIAATDALRYEDTDVIPGDSYTYYIKAEDWGQNLSPASNSISTIIPQEDNEPPSTPANLTYTATPNYVILNWGMSYDETSGVDHYEIQRVNSPFKAKQETVSTTTETTYKDTDVTIGAKYIYYVTAVDRAGNKSVPASVTVTIPEQGNEDHTLYFPHIDVSDYWWTGFAVINPNESDADVTFRFYDEEGNEVATVNKTIPANGKVVSTIRDFFDGNVPENVSWYKIETEKKLDGFELFGTKDWHEMVGVKIFSKPAKRLIYPEVMKDDNHWTGIVLINVDSKDANVTFKAYDANGNELTESSTIALPENGKKVALIEDLFDSFPSETAYLVAETDAKVIGFELYGYTSHVGLAGLSALPFESNQEDNSQGKHYKGNDTKTLSAIVVSATEVQLMWDPIEPTPDTYRIYEVKVQSTPFGQSIEKQQLMGETSNTRYLVTGLTPDTNYTFAVYPVTNGEEGNPTNVVTVKTMKGEPDFIYTYVCPRIEELNGGTTSIAMINTEDSSTDKIKVQLLGEGAEIIEEKTISLGAKSKITNKLSSLFENIPSTSKAIRIVSNKKLIVWENFENNCDNGNNDGYFDTLYAFDRALSEVYFSHIAPQTNMWDSYIAVWNLAEYGNQIKLNAIAPDGSLLSVYSEDILPGDVIAGEIHDFIEDDSIIQNIGWIKVTGEQPMNGYFAFGNKDKTLFAAIEGQ